MYWPALLVSLPSFAIGCLGKYHFGLFGLGVLAGGVIVVVINFSNCAMLPPLLAAMEIFPVLAALISFSLGWAFIAPIKEKENSRE